MNDKVIAITRASSGIGEAIARRLAGEGARLVLAARRSDRLEKLAQELGDKVTWLTVDVADREQVQALVDKAVAEFGRLDVFINNAGVMPLSPLAEVRVDEWDQTIDINIKGVLYGIAAALPQFKKQNSGHLINVSSVAGHIVFANASVYCASKFAVRAISEGFRQEAGPNIRSTIISPGAVQSELVSTVKHQETVDAFKDLFDVGIEADAIARGVSFAINQPDDVDVNELLIRPTAQTH